MEDFALLHKAYAFIYVLCASVYSIAAQGVCIYLCTVCISVQYCSTRCMHLSMYCVYQCTVLQHKVYQSTVLQHKVYASVYVLCVSVYSIAAQGICIYLCTVCISVQYSQCAHIASIWKILLTRRNLSCKYMIACACPPWKTVDMPDLEMVVSETDTDSRNKNKIHTQPRG